MTVTTPTGHVCTVAGGGFGVRSVLRPRSQTKDCLLPLCTLLAPLAEAGALQAAAFLSRSQTKDVSAPSLVQDSGAPAWRTTAARDPGPTLEPARGVPSGT